MPWMSGVVLGLIATRVGLSQNSWGNGWFHRLTSFNQPKMDVLHAFLIEKPPIGVKWGDTKNPHQILGHTIFSDQTISGHAMKFRQGPINGPDWRLKRNDKTMNNHNKSSIGEYNMILIGCDNIP